MYSNAEGAPFFGAPSAFDEYLTVLELDEFLFLDTGFFASEVAQVEDSGATNLSIFADFNFVDEGRVDGEDSLYADASRHFAYCEGGGRFRPLSLNNNTLVLLDTLFVPLTDFVVHRNGVAGREFGKILFNS